MKRNSIYWNVFQFLFVIFRNLHAENTYFQPKHRIQKEMQEKRQQFTKTFISKHLSSCYIFQMSDHIVEGMNDFLRFSTMATINIQFSNLQNSSTETLMEYTNRNTQSFVGRHQEQCIVYILDFKDLQNDENRKNILSILTLPKHQRQALHSYIIFNLNFEAGDVQQHMENIMMANVLKNYPNRISMNFEVSSQRNLQAVLYNYCYYCVNGNEAVVASSLPSLDEINSLSLSTVFPDVTRNFNGHTLRMTVPPIPPLVHIAPSPSNPKKKVIQGMQENIVGSISQYFNFTFSLQMSPGGLTGSQLSNGTWTGTIGDIIYNKADIGLSVATSFDRQKVADFSVSVFYAFLVLVSTKPNPTFGWQAIFYPFTLYTWISVSCSILITILSYKFLHNQAIALEIPLKIILNKDKNASDVPNINIQKMIKHQKITRFKAVYLTVGSLLEQGVPFRFNTVPSRVFVFSWMMLCIVVTCAYKSKLFVFLTFPIVETPPSTFKELVLSDYSWGMKSLGGIALLFITQSPISYVRKIGSKLEISSDKFSCIDKTFQSRFTCITYKAYIEYMSEVRYWKIRHKFYISDFVTPPVGSAWVLPKYSPFLPPLDRVMHEIYEMGLAEKYLNDYQKTVSAEIRAKAQSSNSSKDSFEPNNNFSNDENTDGRARRGEKSLKINNLYGGFSILFFGCSLSGIAFTVEFLRGFKMSPEALRRQYQSLRARFNWRKIFFLYGLQRKQNAIVKADDDTMDILNSGPLVRIITTILMPHSRNSNQERHRHSPGSNTIPDIHIN